MRLRLLLLRLLRLPPRQHPRAAADVAPPLREVQLPEGGEAPNQLLPFRPIAEC